MKFRPPIPDHYSRSEDILQTNDLEAWYAAACVFYKQSLASNTGRATDGSELLRKDVRYEGVSGDDGSGEGARILQ